MIYPYTEGIRVTHVPSGETVMVTNQQYRSQHKMKAVALQIMRARLNALSRGINRSNTEVAVYELPGDEHHPHELSEYQVHT